MQVLGKDCLVTYSPECTNKSQFVFQEAVREGIQKSYNTTIFLRHHPTLYSNMSTSSTNPGLSSKPDQQKPSSSSKTPSSNHNLTAEERLIKEWRTISTNMLNCLSKAEKAASETTKENCKALDESVVNFLRVRMMWHRLMSHVQAKVQGKEQEMQALENYVRTQPRLGKRKCIAIEDDATPIIDMTAAAAVGATSTTPPPSSQPSSAATTPGVAAATSQPGSFGNPIAPP